MTKPTPRRYSVSIPEPLAKTMDAYSAKTGVRLAEIMRRALADYLKRIAR